MTSRTSRYKQEKTVDPDKLDLYFFILLQQGPEHSTGRTGELETVSVCQHLAGHG